MSQASHTMARAVMVAVAIKNWRSDADRDWAGATMKGRRNMAPMRMTKQSSTIMMPRPVSWVAIRVFQPIRPFASTSWGDTIELGGFVMRLIYSLTVLMVLVVLGCQSPERPASKDQEPQGPQKPPTTFTGR